LQRAGSPRLGALEQENDNGGVEPATGCSTSKSLNRKRCRNQAEQSYRNSSTAAPGVELELASSKWYAEHHGELTSMLTMYRHAADAGRIHGRADWTGAFDAAAVKHQWKGQGSDRPVNLRQSTGRFGSALPKPIMPGRHPATISGSPILL